MRKGSLTAGLVLAAIPLGLASSVRVDPAPQPIKSDWEITICPRIFPIINPCFTWKSKPKAPVAPKPVPAPCPPPPKGPQP